MKRKIATIEVFFDPESSESSDSGGKNGQYVLYMNRSKGQPFEIKNLRQFQTVMAHEMGHIISLITGDPTHESVTHSLYQLTNNTDFVLPAERKAWALAHEMGLNLDPEPERTGLESYEKQAQHWGFMHKEQAPAIYYWGSIAFLAALAVLTAVMEINAGFEVLL